MPTIMPRICDVSYLVGWVCFLFILVGQMRCTGFVDYFKRCDTLIPLKGFLISDQNDRKPALLLKCIFWWTGCNRFVFILGALAAGTVFSNWGKVFWFSVGLLIPENKTLYRLLSRAEQQLGEVQFLA